MKKTTFFLLSLLTVFVFTACSDGLDNIEYNRNSDVVLTTPEATATGTSLNVKSSITGNLSSVVKRGFCYSVNVSNPTIKDKVIEADENFSATLSGLKINTPYYIRAYVYGNSRYTYSETFTSTIEITDLNEQLSSIKSGRFCERCKNKMANNLGSMYGESNAAVEHMEKRLSSADAKMRFLDKN